MGGLHGACRYAVVHVVCNIYNIQEQKRNFMQHTAYRHAQKQSWKVNCAHTRMRLALLPQWYKCLVQQWVTVQHSGGVGVAVGDSDGVDVGAGAGAGVRVGKAARDWRYGTHGR